MQNQNSIYKKLIIYGFVFSLLLTGVLRKWVFPDESNALVILPQIFCIMICVFFRKEVTFTIWEKLFSWIGVMTFFTTMFFGHQNVIVATYGCLPYWFGLLTCCILGQVFTKHYIIKISKILVYAGIANSILIIVQFYSPTYSFINLANSTLDTIVNDYEVAGTTGVFRPSGIFMHNSQSTILQTLTFAILLYNLFIDKFMPKWLYCAALALELFSIPFCISRTNVMYHIGIGVFFAFTCFNQTIKKKLIYTIPAIAIMLVVAFSTNFGRQAVRTMSHRFTSAAAILYEGSTTSGGTMHDIYDRNILYNVKAIFNPKTLDNETVPFWGFGQGMSTQVGGRLLGIDIHAGFSLAEWDGLRIMCECGYIFGWSLLFIRIRYSFRYLLHIKEMRENKEYFALAFMPAFLLAFNLMTNWGNIFQANMAYLTAGMFFAAQKFFGEPKTLDNNSDSNSDNNDIEDKKKKFERDAFIREAQNNFNYRYMRRK